MKVIKNICTAYFFKISLKHNANKIQLFINLINNRIINRIDGA